MKLYKVIAHDRNIMKGDIVRRVRGACDDDRSKRYETLDGENFGYLTDEDIVPCEEWIPKAGDKVRVTNLDEDNDWLELGSTSEMKEMLGTVHVIEDIGYWGVCFDRWTWNKEWLELVEEPTKEVDLSKSTPIEKALDLRIETDNGVTTIWLNGVEQKNINSIEFKHYADGIPNLLLGHDIF